MKIRNTMLLAMGLALLFARAVSAAETAPRIAYVALNVFDEKRALAFYEGVLGMSERRRIVPYAGLSEILLGFSKNPADPGVLLVVRNGRDKPYEVGDGFSRFIVNVPNLEATTKRLADAGVALFRPITEAKELRLRYAMAKDPDGYLIEFIQQL